MRRLGARRGGYEPHVEVNMNPTPTLTSESVMVTDSVTDPDTVLANDSNRGSANRRSAASFSTRSDLHSVQLSPTFHQRSGCA